MDEVKSLVRAVVQSKKDGVVARLFQREFSGITGGPVPLGKLGYPSLDAFIRAIPDVVTVGRGKDGEETYFAVADESTMHIQKMISSQRSARKRKPMKVAMRRPIFHTAAWSTHSRNAGFPVRSRGGGVFRPHYVKNAPRPMAPRSGGGGGVGGFGNASRPPWQKRPQNAQYRPPSASKPYNNKPNSNAGPFSKPYSNETSSSTALGFNKPSSNETATSKPFSNSTSQDRPLSRTIHQDRPFSNTTSQDMPFSNTTSQAGPFSKTASQDKPFSNTTSQNKPFSNTASKDKPFSKTGPFSSGTSRNRPFSSSSDKSSDNPPSNKSSSNSPSVNRPSQTAQTTNFDEKKCQKPTPPSLEITASAKSNNADGQPTLKARNSPFASPFANMPAFDKAMADASKSMKDLSVKRVKQTADGNLEVKVTQPVVPSEVVKYGVRYEVAPRFQRRQQRAIDSQKEVSVVLDEETGGAGDGSSKQTPPVKTAVALRRHLSRSGSESGVVDYLGALQAYAEFHKFSTPEVHTAHAGRLYSAGYVSSIAVGPHFYGSGYGAFLTVKAAEEAAIANAIKELAISGDPVEVKATLLLSNLRISEPQADVHNSTLVKSRVQQLTTRRPNGLWSTALPTEYQKAFWDAPPANLVELVETWTDIASVEIVGGDRKIIYPVVNNCIEMVHSSTKTFETTTIKPAILPEEGEILTVLLGHMVDCSHFYVQRPDSPINTIMEQLQEIYEGRGSPKPLVDAEPGVFCVARYEDGLWYRAQLIKVNESADKQQTQTFDILYVDFGNIETVCSRQVRRILASQCLHPAQGMRCGLHAIHCLKSDWSDEVIAAFRDLAMGRELTMSVNSVNGDSCSVELTDPANKKAGSINDQLVSRSLAWPTELPAEPGPLVIPEDSEWMVFVTLIKCTTDLVIRLIGPEYSDKLDELEESMAALHDQPLGDGVPEVGRTYASMSVDEDDAEVTWNRVHVISITDDNCDVILLDHGDVDLVKTESLRLLPAYLNQLPYQAIECKLTGLEPYQTDAEIEAKLIEMALGKACVAEVDDRLGKISLTLWDTSTSEDININEAAAKVLKMENLMPKLPEPGGTIEGYVCHIADNGDIYFQCQGPGLQQLESLAEQMQELYGKAGSASVFVSCPKLDHKYIAKRVADGMWYRAVVTNILPHREVEVYYMDYGYTDVIGYSSLREIGSFTQLRSLPRQAIRCELYELPPIVDGVWTVAALDELAAMAHPDTLCVLEVVVREEGSAPQVAIHSSDSDQPTVNEQLAMLAYSFWTPSTPDGRTVCS